MQQRTSSTLSRISHKKKVISPRGEKVKRKKFVRIVVTLLIYFFASALGGASYAYFYILPLVIRPVPAGALTTYALVDPRDKLRELEELLRKQEIDVASAKINADSSYELQLSTGEVILLTPDKDLNAQVSSLQVILSRLTMEGKRFSRLDLRFDKPVVVLKK